MKYSYFSIEELKHAFELIAQHRPLLAELIEAVNYEFEGNNIFAVSAREKYTSKWFKTKFDGLHVDLLYGDPDIMEMQYVEVPCFESYLKGILDGMDISNAQYIEPPAPSSMWRKFIDLLDIKDDLQTKSFLGSTDRYKKVFMEANGEETREQQIARLRARPTVDFTEIMANFPDEDMIEIAGDLNRHGRHSAIR